jgi:hypothetical protein
LELDIYHSSPSPHPEYIRVIVGDYDGEVEGWDEGIEAELWDIVTPFFQSSVVAH